MIPALRDLQRLRIATAAHPVHQPMFAIDPARPPAGQVAAERPGLAGAGKRVTLAFLDQRIDPFQPPPIVAVSANILDLAECPDRRRLDCAPHR
jgi:hypothetical protein